MDVLPTGGGTVALLGSAGIDTFNRGNKFFELSNHLGNVLVTVSDRKIGQSPVNNLYTSFTADVVSATDYAPFGMQMVGRTFDAGTYRYGFNGKELDKEINSTTTYDYGFRIYSPAIGRFLSVDPLTYSYPYYSPYQFSGNMPIAAIDLDGLEQYVVTYYKDQNNVTTKIEVRAYFLNDGTIKDQNVHKMKYQSDGNGGEDAVPDGGKIAKGNVLVFEVRNEGTKRESVKVVDERNTAQSALTKQELEIFNNRKRLEAEEGPTQMLAYHDTGLDNYFSSDDLVNSETKTYTATWRKPPPTEFKLNANFVEFTTNLKNEKEVKKLLENTVQYLQENSRKVLIISGNTGCSDPALNCQTTMTLNGQANVPLVQAQQQRANSIRDVLIKMGVSPNQLKAVPGKTLYVPSTSTTGVPVNFKLENRKP
jgi:RHS repeat-associated protein